MRRLLLLLWGHCEVLMVQVQVVILSRVEVAVGGPQVTMVRDVVGVVVVVVVGNVPDPG